MAITTSSKSVEGVAGVGVLGNPGRVPRDNVHTFAAVPEDFDSGHASANETTRQQIRGSSLLLVGRGLSVAINFVIQVVTVYYLAKSDYGAFAYAMSIAGLGEIIAALGLDRALSRFVPIYHERRQYDKLFGAVLLMFGTVAAVGLLILASFYVFQGFIGRAVIGDQQALALSLILIGLGPLQAIDRLLTHLFAIFASPASIFFRKYVLEPGLRLLLVLFLVFGARDVFFLAGGYLVIGILCVALYAMMLFRVLRRHELFQHFRLRRVRVPGAEVFAFALPLLTTDAVCLVQSTFHVVLLAHFHGVQEVASFAVILPAARLNELVLTCFGLLFVPLAARLYARNDRPGIYHLCWQTSAWMAVISLPIFLLTFSLARPLTLLLYGERYEASAAALAIVSLGFYFNGVLGFNGLALRALGKVRSIVIIDLAALAINLALDLLLIPPYGALGAAMAMAGTIVVHTMMMQRAVKSAGGVRLLEWRYVKVYLSVAMAALGLLLLQQFAGLSIWISLFIAALISLAAIWINKRVLDVGSTFPELLRLPLARRIFGSQPEA